MNGSELVEPPSPCDRCGSTSPDALWRASWPFCPACAAPQFTGIQTPEQAPHHPAPPPADPT
jgi:hypothetical protein